MSLLAIAVLAISPVILRKSWRGELDDRYDAASVGRFVWGRYAKDGYNASLPTLYVAFDFLMLAVLAYLMLPALDQSVAHSVGFVCSMCMLSCGCLSVSIILFMQPQFAVPPHLKETRGLFSEWHAQRARQL